MGLLGAAYCIYNPSAFLFESVKRIYPFVDRILFLINFKPWQGELSRSDIVNTFNIATMVLDPDDKIRIVSQKWDSEAEQRNTGLALLNSEKIEWCLIIDDDEFFNGSELKNALEIMKNSGGNAAFLVYHQIYWKDRETIIEGLFGSFPTLAMTNGLVNFNENRMILVRKTHTWSPIPVNKIVCHHMSYVRSDREMLRKIQSFSHADTVTPGWYEKIWLDWSKDMINFHPTTPQAFKRAIPASESLYKLEAI